tara:strand:+ start:363 stop:542 length:180 start_codon:yes stop_codon:yes gene_type:complete
MEMQMRFICRHGHLFLIFANGNDYAINKVREMGKTHLLNQFSALSAMTRGRIVARAREP